MQECAMPLTVRIQVQREPQRDGQADGVEVVVLQKARHLPDKVLAIILHEAPSQQLESSGIS